MTQKKRIAFMLAGAAFLMILTLAVPSGNPDDEPEPAGAAPADLDRPDRSDRLPGATKEQVARQRERAAELNWGRDPFTGPGRIGQIPTRNVPSGEPVLTGISARGSERWAIVSQQIVQVGDRLDSGHEVVAIDRKSVTLKKDGKKLVLNLGENQ